MRSLEEEIINQIWSASVLPVTFGHIRPEAEPITIFLGGQPGAGKTAGAKIARKLNSGHNIYPIIGDDYRRYHPNYLWLAHEDPLNMPLETAHAEGKWVGMCVKYADKKGISISIEGTWRNPATVLDEAIRAKQFGRYTHALIIAAPYSISRLRALERFISDRAETGEGRWTPPAAQEEVIKNLSESVRRINSSSSIDRFTVVGLRGIIFDSLHDKRSMGWQSWHDEFKRPLSPEEQAEAKKKITSMRQTINSLNLDPESRKAVDKELRIVTCMYEEANNDRKVIGLQDLQRMIADQTRANRTQQVQDRKLDQPKKIGRPSL